MRIPELAFPPWVLWERRGTITGVRFPGVYLLSITTENLTGRAPEWEEVSYIGAPAPDRLASPTRGP
jgi:hypothetical protein